MVVGYLARQLWQLVPMSHIGVLGTNAGVAVVDILFNKLKTLVAPMELDAAIELTSQTTEALEPTKESRLELGTRRHGHTDAAQRGHGLNETHEDNLAVQAVIQALDELTPEPWVDIGMNVHTHDNLGAGKLAEGVLDAVGDVSSQANLSLHLYIAGAGSLLQFLKQSKSLFACGITVLVVIDNVECHQVAIKSLVAHKHREIKQMGSNLRIFYAKQNLLVVVLRSIGL